VIRPALLLLAAALALPAQAQGTAASLPRWTLDADRSWVHWEIVHFGTSTMRGRFGPVRGEVLWDRASGQGRLGLVIDTTTLDTGLKIFDARIRRDDLLATEAHPQAFFSSGSFRLRTDALGKQELRGEFTLKGTSAPLALRALRFGCRPATAGEAEVCGGDFEATFNRSEFGLSFGLPFVADAVRLVVQVEARRAE
jgi:polyisoprenoid-binding protein YceI